MVHRLAVVVVAADMGVVAVVVADVAVGNDRHIHVTDAAAVVVAAVEKD